MWMIKDILEPNYGCEYKMHGEPFMAMVVLEADDGRQRRFETAVDWLFSQELDIGDEWPDDMDEDSSKDTVARQQDFMNSYYEALEELED